MKHKFNIQELFLDLQIHNLQLLNDILSVSTLEENKLIFHIDKTNLIELINQSSDVIQFAAMEKNLKVIISILPDAPDFIWVDPVD